MKKWRFIIMQEYAYWSNGRKADGNGYVLHAHMRAHSQYWAARCINVDQDDHVRREGSFRRKRVTAALYNELFKDGDSKVIRGDPPWSTKAK